MIRSHQRHEKLINLNLNPGSPDYILATSSTKEKFFAIAFLMSSDSCRYKNLLVELDNDHSKGTGNYPTTLTAAYGLLVNYRSQSFQGNTNVSEGDENDGSEDDIAFLQSSGFVPTCHICGKKGHIALKCPDKTRTNQSDATTPPAPVTSATQLLMNAADDSNSSGLDFSFNPNLANQSDNYSQYVASVCLNIVSKDVFQPITNTQQIIL